MRFSVRLALMTALATVMLVATPAFAQGDGGAGFGLEAGITRATVKAEGVEDFFDSRTGFLAGIWFGGNRNGVLGFMGELAYLVRKTDTLVGPSENHYLEIPALLRINLGQLSTKNGLLIYPLAGPVFDIHLKGELDGFDVKDQFKGLDIGIIAGVGLEIARIGFEGRMNWGQRSLEKDSSGAFGGLVETKSRTFQALMKIRLN